MHTCREQNRIAAFYWYFLKDIQISLEEEKNNISNSNKQQIYDMIW